MADDQSVTTNSSSSSSSAAAPLLRPRQGGSSASTAALRSNALALLLNRAVAGASGRPSTMVRETAAMQLEERRADWGYSKPVVALDIAWNVAFTVVSVAMLCSTIDERPNTPLRVWIGGYALQCVVHVVLVWTEYHRRRRRGRGRTTTTTTNTSTSTSTSNNNNDLEAGPRASSSSSLSSSDSDVNDSEAEEEDQIADSTSRNNLSSIAKRCESINTMTSFLWWIVGFYWIVSGGDYLLHNAPRLYWLAVVFLAFDVFFAIFCIALACMIGIALCCCLPCIIAILYAIAGQEGASESDLSVLPKYRYQICGNVEKSSAGTGSMVPVGGDLAEEHVLLPEDAECCICLCPYEDGVELHSLPCGHNFHATCIVKWLKINASCPLCKYNILKGNSGQL